MKTYHSFVVACRWWACAQQQKHTVCVFPAEVWQDDILPSGFSSYTLNKCLFHNLFSAIFFLYFCWLFHFFFLMFIFERQRERECKRGRGRQRGRPRIWSRLQAPSCHRRAWRRTRTHKLWDHDLSWSQTLNQLSHPGASWSFGF